MKNIFLVLMLISCHSLIAQVDSVYAAIPLYFSDSLGNRDTIYISLSETANLDFNPELGEVNLKDTPFDSVLEIRIVPFADAASAYELDYHVKHKFVPITVTSSPDNDCGDIRIGSHIAFIVHARHYPITISWESEQFQPGGLLECLAGSWIGNTFMVLTTPPNVWLDLQRNDPAYPFGCLADPVEEIEYYPYNSYPIEGDTVPRSLFNPFNDWTLQPVEGSAMDFDTMLIYNLWWATDAGQLCGDIVDVPELVTDARRLKVYPNPVANELNVVLTGASTLGTKMMIHDLLGRRLRTYRGYRETIDLNDLSAGTYVLSTVFADGSVVATRFVKR